MTSEQDLGAKKILTEKGMEVTELSLPEVDVFRKLAQPPVRAFVEKDVGKEWVDKLFAAI